MKDKDLRLRKLLESPRKRLMRKQLELPLKKLSDSDKRRSGKNKSWKLLGLKPRESQQNKLSLSDKESKPSKRLNANVSRKRKLKDNVSRLKKRQLDSLRSKGNVKLKKLVLLKRNAYVKKKKIDSRLRRKPA